MDLRDEQKALSELEFSQESLIRVIKSVEGNLHLGENIAAVNLYLLTARLWLKYAIDEQRQRIERRIEG